MKVVVLWENSREEEDAKKLAEVLVTLAPSLCEADVDDKGSLTMHHRGGMRRNVLVQARPYGEVFREVPIHTDLRTWGGTLARTVLAGTEEVANKPAWQDLPGLIAELSHIYGVDPTLVESLVMFANSAQKAV